MIATLPWSAKKAQWPEGSSEWAVLGWDGGREYGIGVIVIDHLTEDVAKLIAALPEMIVELMAGDNERSK